MAERKSNCWRRRRRHRFESTGSLRIAGSVMFGTAGRVLRCRECGYETCAVGLRLERLLELGARPTPASDLER